MKKFKKYLIAGMSLLCFGLGLNAQNTYDKLWKQVEQAQKKSRPQTVIELTTRIARKAEEEKNAGQLLKATICRNSYQEELTPDSFYINIRRMETWAATEQKAVDKAILHSLLAENYANYAENNSFTLRNSIDVDWEETPVDMREWSRQQFLEKTDYHAQASLHSQDALLDTSSKTYIPFVVSGKSSRFYGHDMYHLLAVRAVDTYRKFNYLGEKSLVKSRIASVYENMIETYRMRQGMEKAVVLASLDYWREKGSKSIEELDTLIAEYGDQDVCAEVYKEKMQLLLGKNRISKALRIYEEALKRYPDYERINALKELAEQMTFPSLSFSTPQIAYPGDSLKVNLTYRNLSSCTLELSHGREKEVKHCQLLPLPHADVPEEEWKYQPNDTVIFMAVPDVLGTYTLRVSADAGKVVKEECTLVASRLKVLTLSLPNDQMEVLVVDAQSGHPVDGATVTFYSTNDKQEDEKVLSVVTAVDGKAVLKWNDKIRSYVVTKGADIFHPAERCYYYNEWRRWTDEDDGVEEKAKVKVELLTDRSLYRPGQTVYVKGIAYEQTGKSGKVLQDKTYRLRLLDVNRREVATHEVRTNEYGSFSSEFTLPTACLNGNFRIEIPSLAQSIIRVEEYKRPSFEVMFHPITVPYCLGDTLVLTGTVKTFSGVALQDVQLSYTVSRRQYRWRSGEEEGVLLTNTLQIDESGNFAIPVHLIPKDSEQLVRQMFEVEAVVTDDSGMTHSATCEINASADAYFFSTQSPSWELCKEALPKISMSIKNAARQLLPIEGIYRLYEVKDGASGSLSEKPIYEGNFRSGEEKVFSEWSNLPSGQYKLQLLVKDESGKEYVGTAVRETVLLFSKKDTRLPHFAPTFIQVENEEFDEEHPACIRWGTSFKDACVLVDFWEAGGRVNSRTLMVSDTLMTFDIPYREEYGESLNVTFALVKNGRLYTSSAILRKRAPERTLQMKWNTFRDRLQPGTSEQWSLSLTTPQGAPASAEMLALMYDASLDAIYRRRQLLQLVYHDYVPVVSWRHRTGEMYREGLSFPRKNFDVRPLDFDSFYKVYNITDFYFEEEIVPVAMSNSNVLMSKSVASVTMDAAVGGVEEEINEYGNIGELPAMRTNFAETAFFLPHLHTNEKGEVVFSFTVPESLTRWNFQGYAHTQDMMTGQMEATIVTAKEFMVTPNMPRFFRVGDEVHLAATITNLTEKQVAGTAVLQLFDPQTEKVFLTRKQKFSNAAGRTSAVDFAFKVSDEYDLVGVRIVADGGNFSDGEQHLLPILSDKEYVVETLPLTIRGAGKHTFFLDSLFNGRSKTATHRRLTVEMTGNPVWYAIQALPVLGQPDTDNAISWAVAYYANALAGYIADSQPAIRKLVEEWKRAGEPKETFLSRLEKNEELKSVLLKETPWLMEATEESERQARLATLFDIDTQKNRLSSALVKLKDLQANNGSWSWYKGMPDSRLTTTIVVELLLRLPLLTGNSLSVEAQQMKEKAFAYLHKQANEEYLSLRKAESQGAKIKNLSGNALEYLYLLTLDGGQVPRNYRPAYNYFLTKLGKDITTASIGRKAREAVVLQKLGRTALASDFITSLKEHLVQTETSGAHFAFNEHAYAWGMRPVSIHVGAMDALRVVGGNEALLEEMKIWLLKQKRTTSWDLPVIAVEAIYALLMGTTDWQESRGSVQVALGKEKIEADSLDTVNYPGMDYLKKTFAEGDAELDATTLTVDKVEDGITWGGVYAQYLSPTADIASHANGEMGIERSFFVERRDASGRKTLQPLTSENVKLKVGDIVVSRITLRLEQAMDFLQLKDCRAACFEPLGALSGYRISQGLGYYVEIGDASTNFCFDQLGKGVYVLEHMFRVTRSGTYGTGLATLQCVYAPEYTAHSDGAFFEIK